MSGSPVLPGLAAPGFDRVTSPVIACIPDPPIIYPNPELVGLIPWVQAYAKQDCKNRGDEAFGIFIGGTNIVFLCPPWFTLNTPMKPKASRPCIGVDRATNRFKGLGYPLARNLRSWLVHELAHVYITAATNRRSPNNEAYSINDCFRIDANSQKQMPQNYVYYAGSMSTRLFIFVHPTFCYFDICKKTTHNVINCWTNTANQVVFYKCFSFPTVSFRDRELSTAMSNGTDDVVWANSTISLIDLP